MVCQNSLPAAPTSVQPGLPPKTSCFATRMINSLIQSHVMVQGWMASRPQTQAPPREQGCPCAPCSTCRGSTAPGWPHARCTGRQSAPPAQHELLVSCFSGTQVVLGSAGRKQLACWISQHPAELSGATSVWCKISRSAPSVGPGRGCYNEHFVEQTHKTLRARTSTKMWLHADNADTAAMHPA